MLQNKPRSLVHISLCILTDWLQIFGFLKEEKHSIFCCQNPVQWSHLTTISLTASCILSSLHETVAVH